MKSKNVLVETIYLIDTFAPVEVIWKHLFSRRKLRKSTNPHRHKKEEFRHFAQGGDFRNDWFSSKIRYWSYLFDHYNLHGMDEVNILEIGSWEGMSALFFLTELPNARLTCVDTWEGSEEHKDGKKPHLQKTGKEEKRFDKNIAAHKDRVTKLKCSSLAFFAEDTPKPSFDLIHVDGSHKADDVMSDALNSFARLKPGGFMIFDDYLWRHFSRSLDNPAAAINCFLKLKKDQLQILIVSRGQLIIRKTADT